MEPQSFESTITVILLLFAALFVLAYIVVEIGKKNIKRANQEKLFYERYGKLQSKVEYWPIDQNHYTTLSLMIEALKKLPFKEREKVEVLETTFKRRFGVIRDKIISEESSARSVLQN